MWSNYAGAGDAVRFVRVGTLDEPDRLPPDIHIFTASKQPWVVLPPGTPAVPEYYQRSLTGPRTAWRASTSSAKIARCERGMHERTTAGMEYTPASATAGSASAVALYL